MVGLGFVPGAQDSVAQGVSADGRVIVGHSGRAAFRWTAEGGMVSLVNPGETSSAVAYATSADGSVVVGESDGRAFVWDEANGVRDLQSILEAAGVLAPFPDAQIVRANGVSADGTVIVGDAFGLGNDDMLVWRATFAPNGTAIPLPPAVWAGAGGLVVALAVVRFHGRMPRHRRRK